jgi:HAD superfamily hydrolase (TIGR01509 family)
MEGITTFIFDIGGVLITPAEKVTPYILSEICHVSLASALLEYEAVTSLLRTGKMSVEQLAETIIIKHETGVDIKDFDKLYTEFYKKQAIIDEDMLALLPLLSERYTLVALSNMIELHARINEERQLFTYFQNVYLSCRTGISKPDKKAYEQVFRDYSVPPESCYVIDDQEDIVDKAREYGCVAVHFESAPQLLGHLKKEGLI